MHESNEMQRGTRLACMLVYNVYELASCLKGAAGSQICQSGAAMPGRLAPLLATNHLASATVIMFALQNRIYTSSAPTQIGVTEPFLVPMSDNLPVAKHPIILYVCLYLC
jgi:hypothetical protein